MRFHVMGAFCAGIIIGGGWAVILMPHPTVLPPVLIETCTSTNIACRPVSPEALNGWYEVKPGAINARDAMPMMIRPGDCVMDIGRIICSPERRQ